MQIFPPELIEAIANSGPATPVAIRAVVRHLERDWRLMGETGLLNFAHAMAIAAMTGNRDGVIRNEPTLSAEAKADYARSRDGASKIS